MPSDMQEIARELIESFPDAAVLPADPFVRDVGWVTIETPQEKYLNEQVDPPDVQFLNLEILDTQVSKVLSFLFRLPLAISSGHFFRVSLSVRSFLSDVANSNCE